MSSPSSPNWLLEQLPVGMLTDDFLVRFTTIFQDVADTLVDSVDSIDAAVDLTVAPEEFVRWLGSWIAAQPNPGEGGQVPGDPRERTWIQAQTRALAGRGTRPGLELMLTELCAGQPVRVIDGGGVYPAGQAPAGDPAWVQVELPALGPVAADDVLELIRAEVPVHVAVHLLVEGIAVEGAAAAKAVSGRSAESGSEIELVAGGGAASTRVVGRLPGTAGRAGQPFRSCWSCAERHPLHELDCWRCGAPHTRPEPEPEPEPEPVRVEFGPTPDFDPTRSWPLVLAAVLAVLVLVLLVTGLVLN